MRPTNFLVSSSGAAAAAILAVVACGSSESSPPGPGAGALPPIASSTTPLPGETAPPSVYVAKVKNLLVGLPPTDAEVEAVEADPAKLTGLIDGWMAMPEYQDKMLRFFELAFQQTQVDVADFSDQTYPRPMSANPTSTPLLVQNATESFARTVLALVAAGRPLTEAMTTRSFMMTPPLMELYAFFDAWQVDDSGTINDRFAAANPDVAVKVTSAAVPMSESVDPTSPNFMLWHSDDLATFAAKKPGCGIDPVTYTGTRVGAALHFLITGSFDVQASCSFGGTAAGPQFGADEYSTWKMVTIRPPKTGEAPTAFYDLPKLRAESELVLQIPRVGFFSTPAFFANWQTNDSNQMRATMNQALIVALGAAVDGTDSTVPSSTPGIDKDHAGDPQCFACHKTLDPTRSIFSANWSWNYHDQDQTSFATQSGLFAFRGVEKPVKTLDDFGNVLATHPLFAQAWAQKLCYYANSRACSADDPEFNRVVGVFQSSNYSWNTLVRELLASPLTTNAKPTKTLAQSGELIAVSRRDHFCAALNHRLGLADICGLGTTLPAKKTPQATIVQIVPGLPSDGYGRGSTAPVLPNDPTLFYRAGVENICENVAAIVVDGPADATSPNAKRWTSGTPTAAIADFVSLIMGLTPSDPRSQPSQVVLQGHFDAARASGVAASDALRSTFVLACLSPSSLSIGL